MDTSFREQLYATYVTGHQGVLDADRRNPTLTRDVIRRLPPDRQARILDAGCGQGDLVALMRTHGWHNVSGIDLSPEQIATATRRDVAGVVCADIYEHAAQHAHRYDAVLAIDFVEHFDRIEALTLFRALRSMVAPGGRLILQTPNGASPFSGRIFWSDMTHGMLYTDRSLRQICSAAGFVRVHTFPTRPVVHGIVSGLRACAWRVIEGFLWLATAAETGRTRGLILTQNVVAVAYAH